MSAEYTVYLTRPDGKGPQLYASSERLASAEASYRLACRDRTASMVWIIQRGQGSAVRYYSKEDGEIVS